MKNKVLTLLGFASKANKLSYGMNMTVASIKAGKAKLVLLSSEMSEKSQKEINFFSNKNSVKTVILNGCSAAELSHAVGKRCAVVSVNDLQFATAITKEEMLNDEQI